MYLTQDELRLRESVGWNELSLNLSGYMKVVFLDSRAPLVIYSVCIVCTATIYYSRKAARGSVD